MAAFTSFSPACTRSDGCDSRLRAACVPQPRLRWRSDPHTAERRTPDPRSVSASLAPEAAINEADKLDLVDPEALRAKLDRMPRRPGVGALRRLLDRTTLLLTDSELERRSIPIAGRAGLPAPETGIWLHGSKVDFYWPDLGLAVETDGLRYHRSPTQQARDRRRDQALTPAGLTPLRFTHAQIAFDADDVEATLRAVVMSLLRLAA
jgi:Protein of unknown function (DUF559)